MDVYKFGFTNDEQPIINALCAGASLAELEVLHREVDPRIMQSIVYALASFKVLTVGKSNLEPPRTTTGDRVNVGRVPTNTITARTMTPREPIAPRTMTPRESIAAREPSASRTQTRPLAGRAPTRRPFDDRVEPPGTGRTPTRPQPNPDRVEMSAVGRVLAPSCTATTQGLGTRAQGPTIPSIARAPSESGIATPRTKTSQDDRERAQESFKRGELAVRAQNFEAALSEVSRACELSPGNFDFAALLAWVRFCLASDKEGIAADTRRALEKAVHRGDNPVGARFYLGRVERMTGRESEALRRFREVLEQQPSHAEAASEVRVLEARLAANSKR